MLRATVAAAREALTHRPVSSTAAHNAAVQQLQHLRELMSQLGAEDFAGLLKPPQSPAPVAPVLYQHVDEGEGYSMGVFVLPPHGSIPLHNHPGMCVLSKLLYGDLTVKSYDFAVGEHEDVLAELSSGGTALAWESTTVLDTVGPAPGSDEGGQSVSLLSAQHGNLHTFSTTRGCAIFDLLTPPYDDDAGRSCTYYATRLPTEAESRAVLPAALPQEVDGHAESDSDDDGDSGGGDEGEDVGWAASASTEAPQRKGRRRRRRLMVLREALPPLEFEVRGATPISISTVGAS